MFNVHYQMHINHYNIFTFICISIIFIMKNNLEFIVNLANYDNLNKICTSQYIIYLQRTSLGGNKTI